MILKRLLGEMMTDMGFITLDQLEKALHQQKRIFEETMVPERLQRTRLVSEARMSKDADRIPLLGQILVDMEYITPDQLDLTLKQQESMIDEYNDFDTVDLGIAIEIGSIVNSSLNVAEVLAFIMRHANRVTHSIASTLMLLDDETGELVFSVPTGPKADKLRDIHIPPGEGIAGWVVKTGKPLLVADVQNDNRFYGKIDEISGLETTSLLCVPLKAKGKMIGVLEVVNKADGTIFTEKDAKLLSIFAHQAALAIENSRLYAELRERLEQELLMQRQMSEYDKFRALGQMASGVGHDFNNLLMGIQGNASLALTDMDPNDPGYQKLKNIEESVKNGTELTRQLLDFAKGGDYELKTTDFNVLVKKCSDMFGRTKKEIRIHRIFDSDLWKAKTDQGQIEQVLLTLFVNASQAMPSGGDIWLQNENIILHEEESTILHLEPGAYVKISVKDNGLGMDEQTRGRILDPFFSTKQMGRGTGLGLASAYGIIKNHRGTIQVQSQKGKGSTFIIYLPVSDMEAAKEDVVSGEIMRGEETVLFVDDEEMIIDVGNQILSQLGYNVMLARGGKEALKFYQENQNKIDLVILDMIMPDLPGGEVYDRLRALNPKVKVLLCSGYSIDGQANEILQRCCDGFIQKPFNLEQFSQLIREILDK